MNRSSLFSKITMTAVIAFSSVTPSTAGFPAPPGVNVQINGYLPPPPGVNIQMDAGRPYYVERDRRVYVERDPKHHKKKHHKQKHKYKDHEDNGRKNGHGKH